MGRAPEWRQDPLTERLVLISPERAERPLHPGSCPFCEGNEAETPPEVLAFRNAASTPNGPGWRVRVVPNRYAAVRLDLASSPLSASERGVGGERSPGVGVGEVFIECTHHETKFRNLPRDQMVDAIRAWRDRLRFWREDGRLRFAMVFKNEGPDAGASVEHCHSQLIAVAEMPESIRNEQGTIYNAIDRGNECPLCELLSSPNDLSRCLVAESPLFAAICPIAPRLPGETWICPRQDRANFDRISDDELGELADLSRDVLNRISRTFSDPDFNLIVRTAPFGTGGLYHWRIEILPRTTRIAGWELGTGIFINTMFPEDAARLLREAR